MWVGEFVCTNEIKSGKTKFYSMFYTFSLKKQAYYLTIKYKNKIDNPLVERT